ncbi:MAG: hypothetical protein GXO78_13425 [Calditrichaeota bacterium]|nr:hypothetical protein [Calditrichota bacterium]
MTGETERKIRLNEKLVGLMGLALRARLVELGFEAVKRNIEKNKIAFVLLSEEISADSAKRIRWIAERHRVPVFAMQDDLPWRTWLGIDRFKIIGMRRGEMARGFLKHLN